jgi:predicted nucleic acid-binding protein
MIPRARQFIHDLEDNDYRILVPTVVMFELMMVVPPDQHHKFLGYYRRHFLLADLNAPASKFAAEVWYRNSEDGTIDAIRDEPEATKTKAKVDCQIIGTALAHEVTTVYSEDPHIKRLGDGFLTVRGIEGQIPLDLEEGEEARQGSGE